MSAALVGLGAGALGALGNIWSNSENKKMMREQMAFQERMANTQYQRGMADMKKAGLNPILAYQKGGASSPSGAMATMTNPVSGAMRDAGTGVNTALDLKLKKQQLDVLKKTAFKEDWAGKINQKNWNILDIQKQIAEAGKDGQVALQQWLSDNPIILQGEYGVNAAKPLMNTLQNLSPFGALGNALRGRSKGPKLTYPKKPKFRMGD